MVSQPCACILATSDSPSLLKRVSPSPKPRLRCALRVHVPRDLVYLLGASKSILNLPKPPLLAIFPFSVACSAGSSSLTKTDSAREKSRWPIKKPNLSAERKEYSLCCYHIHQDETLVVCTRTIKTKLASLNSSFQRKSLYEKAGQSKEKNSNQSIFWGSQY